MGASLQYAQSTDEAKAALDAGVDINQEELRRFDAFMNGNSVHSTDGSCRLSSSERRRRQCEKSKERDTVLMDVISLKRRDVAEELLLHNLKMARTVFSCFDDDNTEIALHRVKDMDFFRQAGCDAKAFSWRLENPIQRCSKRAVVVARPIHFGADVNLTMFLDRTLHGAENEEIIVMLLDRETNVNARGIHGRSPLSYVEVRDTN